MRYFDYLVSGKMLVDVASLLSSFNFQALGGTRIVRKRFVNATQRLFDAGKKTTQNSRTATKTTIRHPARKYQDKNVTLDCDWFLWVHCSFTANRL